MGNFLVNKMQMVQHEYVASVAKVAKFHRGYKRLIKSEKMINIFEQFKADRKNGINIQQEHSFQK